MGAQLEQAPRSIVLQPLISYAHSTRSVQRGVFTRCLKEAVGRRTGRSLTLPTPPLNSEARLGLCIVTFALVLRCYRVQRLTATAHADTFASHFHARRCAQGQRWGRRQINQ